MSCGLIGKNGGMIYCAPSDRNWNFHPRVQFFLSFSSPFHWLFVWKYIFFLYTNPISFLCFPSTTHPPFSSPLPPPSDRTDWCSSDPDIRATATSNNRLINTSFMKVESLEGWGPSVTGWEWGGGKWDEEEEEEEKNEINQWYCMII